jgi:hypothetical protein
LDISTERQLRDVIEYLVPLLPTAIECHYVAFVGTHDLRSTNDCACDDSSTIISAGPSGVDNEAIVSLIANFSTQAMSRPLVVNGHNDQRWPTMREIALTRVFKRERHWGWLIACNRNTGSLTSETSQPQPSKHEFGTNDTYVLASAAAVLATQAHNADLRQQEEDLVVNIVRSLVTSLEAKDHYTRGHAERVAMYARLLAKQLKLSDEDCQRIHLTGLLHDIGKIGVPDATLTKPGELTTEEFDQIKKIPEVGWQILHGLGPLDRVLPGVLHHHERVDGKGYPDGLVGDAIHIDGRILAVADAYDAMTSHRSYRARLPQEQAEEILGQGAGIQWDATVIEAFFEIMPEIIRFRKSYRAQPLRGTRRRKPYPQR